MENRIFYLKKLAVYSAITGIFGALISLIPIFMPPVSLFLLPFFGSIPPLGMLIFLDKYKSRKNSDWSIMGAFSGAVVCACYLILFIPLVYIIHIFMKNYYDYGIQFLNFFLCILLFIVIETVYLAANAVIGLAVGAVYNYIEGK